jgi:general secretion pathway protein C
MIQKSFAIANLLIVIIGVYVGVGIFYGRIENMVQIKPIVPDFQPQSEEPTGNIQNPESYYELILTRNLFDLKKTTNESDPGLDVNSLEQTKLNLKLWGTVSGVGQQAYAVIEDTSKREQNLYRKGDDIQNATIKMILREKVVLSVRGKDEVLEMEKMEGGSSPFSVSRRFPTSVSSSLGSRSMPTQRITLQRSMIEESIQDINKLMTQVKIMPHLEDGQPSGLSVSNIQPNSIFRRMGLRNGDILMGVDGENIQSVDDALKLYQNLTNAEGVKVQLKRRGRERTIDYSIR